VEDAVSSLHGSELSRLLALVLAGYVAVMFGLGLVARRRIGTVEDFVVAGRRLPLLLAWPTLLATWFGAGTLLIATDEVRAEGLVRGALDPFGAGACLLLAGWLLAARLWGMSLLTLPDFFGRRFGPRAEWLSAVLMVPGYFGWIAAQFVAVAGLLHLFFDIPVVWGIAIAAAVGMGYTLLGGMWSVTLTDAVQMGLVVLGLGVLGWEALSALGGGSGAVGMARLWEETPPGHLQVIPLEDAVALLGWLGVFAAGALGNLPGQDLTQRIFAARSARVARAACLLAGASYLVLGLAPLLMGLAANLLLPGEAAGPTLPLLAHLFLEPRFAVLLLLAVLSAVLSTIDSAILSPATVLAENVWRRADRASPRIAHHRLAVVLVTGCSVAVAYLGEDAYSLLESAYEVGLVSLFVPLLIGIRSRRGGERAALTSMAVGTGLWLVHRVAGWEHFVEPLGGSLPVGLTCAAVGGLAYAATGGWRRGATRAD
jgi:solute:Na+ symporter, SSS family